MIILLLDSYFIKEIDALLTIFKIKSKEYQRKKS